jgi:hypothetical protein
MTLADGVISVELFARPDAAAPFRRSGRQRRRHAATGESIRAAGRRDRRDAVEIAGIAAASSAPMPAGLDLVGAMRVTFAGTLARPATVSCPVPASLGDATRSCSSASGAQSQTRFVLVGAAHLVGDALFPR